MERIAPIDWQALTKSLGQALQQPLEFLEVKPLSGGDINQAVCLRTQSQTFFVKFNAQRYQAMMAAEQHSLQTIAQTQTIRCPIPIAHGRTQDCAWLAMEPLRFGGRRDDFARGRALALLHQNHNQGAKPFGWLRDNFIGTTPQLNSWHSDWIEFYAQQRLAPQLQWAQQNGAPQRLMQTGTQLLQQLDWFFQDYTPAPSLLHGDLWAGNSGFLTDGTPVIFDPASYYGDRETDLAMTELFGGFSPDFYLGYDSLYPRDKGYAQRVPLYNLYHILNHFNLFGGHYAQQAQSLIERLLKKALTESD